jgi:hypothetical protein
MSIASSGALLWRTEVEHWINSLALSCAGRVVVSSHHNLVVFFDAASGTELEVEER